ncbi:MULTISPECIES: hypothetical protein [unclassified Streptomyces]|uniref:hypothetical protein n=1 Tax=unclassified Streptomyces TaxID=2593676 RepID=UPI0006892487|nr:MULTISPECIES: hypothetical protein [unclassified Streptomyces]
MDAAWVGLLAAAVGVGGTLGSAWLTQRRNDVARREEWDRVERSRLADRADQRTQERLAARSAAYTAFNATTRNYLAYLNDHVHALQRGAAETDDALGALETARKEFRQIYAEAQLIVPDTVLPELRQVHLSTAQAYAILSRLSRGTAEDGEDINAAQDSINHCWDVLFQVRAMMRADLNATGPSYE